MKNCRESQQVSLILKGAFKRTLMAFCNFHYQRDGNHRERVLGMWRMCRSLCGSAEKPEKSRQGSWSIQRFLIDFGKQLQLPSTAMGKQSTKYIFFFKWRTRFESASNPIESQKIEIESRNWNSLAIGRWGLNAIATWSNKSWKETHSFGTWLIEISVLNLD